MMREQPLKELVEHHFIPMWMLETTKRCDTVATKSGFDTNCGGEWQIGRESSPSRDNPDAAGLAFCAGTDYRTRLIAIEGDIDGESDGDATIHQG